MGYSPAAIRAVYPILKKYYPSMQISGIYANKPGYHNARVNLPRSDYSVQEDLDRLGDGNAGSAIDATMNKADLRKLTQRMLTASKARDPRLVKGLREWFASLDGNGVDGWSLFRKRFATSDSSHEWHFHGSGWRKYVNDDNVWLGVAEVMCGLAPGTLTKPPKLLPVYVVDPLKVSTTLTANAPAGKEDIQRKPGFRITTGVKIVTEDGKKWLVTLADYSYRMDFLVLESEFKKRKPPVTPPDTKPTPEEPPVPAVELDARKLVGDQEVTHRFALYPNNDRAMQCPAPTDDGRFFVSQALTSGGVEDLCVTENLPDTDGDGVHKRGRWMRIVGGGHGSTIAVIMRKGEPWILCKAWGELRLIKFRSGYMKKGWADNELYSKDWSYGVVDHKHPLSSTGKAITMRKGNAYKMFELTSTGKMGKLLGAAANDLVGPGPSQGYFTVCWNGRNYLFTCWDYGAATSQPTIVVGSLDTGKKLYSLNIRDLVPDIYGRKEPESGFGIDVPDDGFEDLQVAHLGLSVTRGSEKLGVALAMPLPLPQTELFRDLGRDDGEIDVIPDPSVPVDLRVGDEA